MLPLLVAALLSAAPPPPRTPDALEAGAYALVTREFERVGRRPPTRDTALDRAARDLAEEALRTGASGALELVRLTEAVSDAGASDPSPRSYMVRSTSRPLLLETLGERRDLAEEPATHVGVGVADVRGTSALVVLVTDRKATLEPFPRSVAKAGSGFRLCGTLGAGLRAPEVYVTRPDGDVTRPLVEDQKGQRFCSRVGLGKEGRYALEVVARSDRGPEVAALFVMDVGPRGARGATRREEEPTDVDTARELLRERINGLRRAHGAQALAADAGLDAVAQAYAQRMAKEGFFAHVAPDGSDVRQRMRGANIAYASVGENLGLAEGPLAAHFGIEHSPGHRRNLLGAQFTHVGLGVAFQKLEGGRRQALLVEVLASLTKPSKDPLADAYRALDARRRARKLEPLQRSAVLEAIAQDHARRALKADKPSAELPGSVVHERVFASMDARSTAVDVLVVADPSQVPDSRSLGDARNDRVGVGAVRGDSPTYGEGRYWVVIVYAAAAD